MTRIVVICLSDSSNFWMFLRWVTTRIDVIRVSFAALASSANLIRNITPSGCSPILAKIFWELSLSVKTCVEMIVNQKIEVWFVFDINFLVASTHPLLTTYNLMSRSHFHFFQWVNNFSIWLLSKLSNQMSNLNNERARLVVQTEEHIIHNWLLLFCYFSSVPIF